MSGRARKRSFASVCAAGDGDDGEVAEQGGPGTTALAALSPAGYPLLAETASFARDVPPEQEFGQGLAILLRGLAADIS